jgi:hypothetical protein
MWRLFGLVLLTAGVACDASGRWPGARDGFGDGDVVDPPDGSFGLPDAGFEVPDAGPFDGSNIVVNGGFERLTADTSFAARWTPEDSNPGGSIAIVDTQSYTGQRALQYDIGAAGEGYEFFVVQDGLSADRLVPGGTYELAGFFRINQVGGGSINFNYILRGDTGDPDIGNDWDNTHPVQLNTWEPFAWQFTIPNDYSAATYSLYLHLIKFTSTRIVLHVDEVSLLRIR